MRTALTDRAVKAAKSDISDAVVPGLLLRVRPSGAKSYALVARFPGSSNPTRRSLGAVGAISLGKAREKARTWLALLDRGIDPATVIKRERMKNIAFTQRLEAAVEALREIQIISHAALAQEKDVR